MANPTAEEPTRSLGKKIPNSLRTNAAPSSTPTRVNAKAGPPATTRAGTVRRAPKPGMPRPGSKAATVLELLQRPQGVGLKDLIKATGWQPHSVRGFLSGIVTKKMGLKVKSIKAESGERRYKVLA